MIQTNEIIYEFIETNAESFERRVLGRMLMDSGYANGMKDILFADHTGGPARSFAWPDHTGLAHALVRYHQILRVSSLGVVDWSCLQACVKHVADDGKLSGDTEVLTECWNKLTTIAKETTDNWQSVLHMTTVGTVFWMKQTRMSLATSLAKSQKWSADALQSWLRQEATHISRLSKQERVDSDLWQALSANIPDVVRVPCSIPRLNAAVGGGFGRGEGTMIICASGAGKTVIGTQFAGEWCAQNMKGVYVTTEPSQDSLALGLRMVSQNCGVPYAQVVNGMNTSKMQPSQLQDLNRFSQIISPERFRTLEWYRKPNTSAVETLRDDLESLALEMGGLDFFILDWIGGAMGDAYSQDPKKLRLIFQTTANLVPEMAAHFDCIGLCTAQGHNASARNKARVVAADARECKSMDERMTNVIGVSAIYDKNENANCEGESFSPDQYLFASKVRKGPGGLVPVRRMFEYQKFVPRSGVTPRD